MTRRLVLTTLTLATLTFAVPAAAVVDVNLVGGLDLYGSLDLDALSSSTHPGFSLGLEVMFDVPVVELGAGLEYGFPRAASDGGGKIEFWQLYGIARLTVFARFFLVGRLGYASPSANDFVDGSFDDSGASWGMGAGLAILRNLKAELLYSDLSGDVEYSYWSARAVYTF
jgi:hypothetical protein